MPQIEEGHSQTVVVKPVINKKLENVDAALSPGIDDLLRGVRVNDGEEVRAGEDFVDLKEGLVKIDTILKVANRSQHPRLLLLFDLVAFKFLLALEAEDINEILLRNPLAVVIA